MMDQELVGLDTAIADTRDNIQTLSAKLVRYDSPSGVRYMGDMILREVHHLTQLLAERDQCALPQRRSA
jgi:hypothetical protein